jgi:riboflavin kinase/FMN adenylyltransferase
VSHPSLPHVVNHDSPVPIDLRGSVIVLGNFDGVHLGHRALIERASLLAGEREAPLAIMSSEPHPRQFLNPSIAPFRLSSRRGKQLVFAANGIDLLYEPSFDVAFATRSPEDFIADILVDYLGVSGVVVGDDFRFGHKRSGSVEDLVRAGRAAGFSVDVVPELQLEQARLSSTRIRSWIAEGKLALAHQALCGTWLTSVSIVEDGTVLFESHQLLPPAGQYQVQLLDRSGAPLGFEILTITPTRHAHLSTNRVGPGAHLISDWRQADCDN